MKRQRQALIEKKIKSGKVKSQRELVEMLEKEGYQVSQTTVSRDLAELGFSRGRDSSGFLAYGMGSSERYERPDDGRLAALAPQLLLEAEPTGNLVVVKTTPGNAQGLAWAIDRAELKGIAGTVAGDDTIMVACSAGADSRRVARRLAGYATGRK